MGMNRAWRYRLYPSKLQEKELNSYLQECKNLWNSLLEYTKKHHEETGKLPTRKQLYLLTKETQLFSQVSQNVADRLSKSLKVMIAKKKTGKKAGFPRLKSIDRVKSFSYPQFGFKLDKMLELSSIGSIAIKKHRDIKGKLKTLTIKKTPTGKWFAVFISQIDETAPEMNKQGSVVGIDLGIENFAYFSNGTVIENPRHLKKAEEKLKKSKDKYQTKGKRVKTEEKQGSR